jgi:hypothetical protein
MISRTYDHHSNKLLPWCTLHNCSNLLTILLLCAQAADTAEHTHGSIMHVQSEQAEPYTVHAMIRRCHAQLSARLELAWYNSPDPLGSCQATGVCCQLLPSVACLRREPTHDRAMAPMWLTAVVNGLL